MHTRKHYTPDIQLRHPLRLISSTLKGKHVSVMYSVIMIVDMSVLFALKMYRGKPNTHIFVFVHRNDWKNFEPYTNILWLHYTVDKMITALRYKRTNTKIHKHYIAKLKGIKNRILDYGSAAQFVLTDNEF